MAGNADKIWLSYSDELGSIYIPVLAGIRENHTRNQGISRALDGSFGVSDFAVENRTINLTFHGCQFSDFTELYDFFENAKVNYSQFHFHFSPPMDQDDNTWILRGADFANDGSNRRIYATRLVGAKLSLQHDTAFDVMVSVQLIVDPTIDVSTEIGGG